MNLINGIIVNLVVAFVAYKWRILSGRGCIIAYVIGVVISFVYIWSYVKI